LEKIEGAPIVRTEAQIEALLQAGNDAEKRPLSPEGERDPGEELRDVISALVVRINEHWDHYDVKRAQITKLFTPTPPKVEEK
jgi:hypothetical protein